MKLNIQHNYYPEDMVPYSVVRDHLRYDYGDAEELVKSYVASACDYMETLTNRVFCSSAPERHEIDEDNYNPTPNALNATVTVFLDKGDIDKVQKLRNITGDWTVASEEYWHDDPATTEVDETVEFVQGAEGTDMTDAVIFNDTYPIEIDWTGISAPADIHAREKQVYKIVLSGGDNVKDLPRQYRQAMLLLVGHYDSQREAEYVGGLTTEIKEGVQRLLATVKVY
jgi:hypothetical protein